MLECSTRLLNCEEVHLIAAADMAHMKRNVANIPRYPECTYWLPVRKAGMEEKKATTISSGIIAGLLWGSIPPFNANNP